MKAFILSLTVKKPLRRPMSAAHRERDGSDTGSTSHSGVSVRPRPMPREQNNMPVTMAASAAVDSTERSMWPAMMTMARPIAITPTKVDCSTMLAKMPIWKKFGTKSEKTISTTASMNQTRWSSTNSAMARWRGDVHGGSVRRIVSLSPVIPAKRRDDGKSRGVTALLTPPA